MRLFTQDQECIKVMGSAATLRIERTKKPDRWDVTWEVVQFLPTGEVVQGRRIFTTEELEAAFGLRFEFQGEGEQRHNKWFCGEYGGDIAKQGKFIRAGDYLNIPCPGTGHDGDPNVSIELDEKIKTAVRQLIACTSTPNPT